MRGHGLCETGSFMDTPAADLNSAGQLGRVVGVTGSGAVARLFKVENEDGDQRVTIGRLVGVSVDASLIVASDIAKIRQGPARCLRSIA